MWIYFECGTHIEHIRFYSLLRRFLPCERRTWRAHCPALHLANWTTSRCRSPISFSRSRSYWDAMSGNIYSYVVKCLRPMVAWAALRRHFVQPSCIALNVGICHQAKASFERVKNAYCVSEAEYQRLNPQKTPFREYFGGNWPRYNGTILEYTCCKQKNAPKKRHFTSKINFAQLPIFMPRTNKLYLVWCV